MNVDAAGRFDPAHLEKWRKVTRAYLAGPLAELRSDDAVKEATRHPVPQVRSDRSGCHQAFRKPFQAHFYGKAEVRQ
ncbi:MAG: hypothetical protein Q8L56_00460 [Rhodocyclaceae bacterium]|nr:hypothetical protein [Rhodocyclaceae bacterium]